MANTPSDHAQCDLRVSDVKISADFVEVLNRAEAPLPWDVNDVRQVIDANGYLVCDVDGPHGQAFGSIILTILMLLMNFFVPDS